MSEKQVESANKRTWRREIKVIVIGSAILAGSIVSFDIFPERFQSSLLLPIVVTMFILPKVFDRVGESNAPLAIKFAQAFQMGFLSLQSMVLGILVKFQTHNTRGMGVRKESQQEKGVSVTRSAK